MATVVERPHGRLYAIARFLANSRKTGPCTAAFRSAVGGSNRSEQPRIRTKILRLLVFMLGQPITAMKLTVAAVTICACTDVRLAPVPIGDIEEVDADHLHHVVHKDGLMKVSKLRPWLLHGHPPALVALGALNRTIAAVCLGRD